MCWNIIMLTMIPLLSARCFGLSPSLQLLLWWRWADQSYRRDFCFLFYSIPMAVGRSILSTWRDPCFYSTSFQNQPIVPPWSSQAVLKLEHKSSQVREHLNSEIIMYYHPRHHDRHMSSMVLNLTTMLIRFPMSWWRVPRRWRRCLPTWGEMLRREQKLWQGTKIFWHIKYEMAQISRHFLPHFFSFAIESYIYETDFTLQKYHF